MHTPGWERCIAELCRIARSKIVVDFPAAGSAAAVLPIVRRVRARLRPARHDERQRPRTDLEAYRVFTLTQIRRAFGEHGFSIARVHRQFALPIALHKAIGVRAFTTGVEGALRAIGLIRLVGSPVTVLAERNG
jgi:hypothetical protein